MKMGRLSDLREEGDRDREGRERDSREEGRE